jgi:hypothetical protein
MHLPLMRYDYTGCFTEHSEAASKRTDVINKFITNKYRLSMNREPLLHVSTIVYNHLHEVPTYIVKEIYSLSSEPCQIPYGKLQIHYNAHILCGNICTVF